MLKKAIGIPDDEVSQLETRLSDTASAQAASVAEKASAEKALMDAERIGDTKTADASAATITSAVAKLERLAIRKQAIGAALSEAKSARASEEKKARIESMTLALDKATKAADAAQARVVSMLVQLGEACNQWDATVTVEAASCHALDAAGVEVSHPPRYQSAVENAAMKALGTQSSFEVKVPVPVKQ